MLPKYPEHYPAPESPKKRRKQALPTTGLYAAIQANRARRNPEAWRDAAFLLAVLALGILCILGGSGCAEIAALRYDSVAREVIDGDIAARAKRARAAISAAPMEIDAVAMEVDLQAIEKLATTGVHRAQTAQLFWGARKDEISCAISTEANPNPEDDRQVVTMAGLALEKDRRRWFPRTGEDLRKSVSAVAGAVARAVIVEVPRAIIPWWLWPIIVCLVLAAVAAYAWSRYQRWIVIPRIKRETEEAQRELTLKEQALDEYDQSVERLLDGRSHEEKAKLAAGEHLEREHRIRNDRRKRERKEMLDSVLPIKDESDPVLHAVEEKCQKRERDTRVDPPPQE